MYSTGPGESILYDTGCTMCNERREALVSCDGGPSDMFLGDDDADRYWLWLAAVSTLACPWILELYGEPSLGIGSPLPSV